MLHLEKKIVRNIEALPSLPTSVQKILEVTQDPYVAPAILNKVISLDPILTGRVLHLVNSAYYSLSSRVTSVVKAIILLGVNTIRNLALSSVLVPLVEDARATTNRWMVLNGDDYWMHSLGVGVTAKMIAKELGVFKDLLEDYFVAGILHDVGKVILDITLKDEYLKVINRAEAEDIALITAETRILNINHCEVGLLLADKWGLSPSIKESIKYHHRPRDCSDEHRGLVHAVYVANGFCNNEGIGFSGNSSCRDIDPSILDSIKLDNKQLLSKKSFIEAELKKASIFMKIK